MGYPTRIVGLRPSAQPTKNTFTVSRRTLHRKVFSRPDPSSPVTLGPMATTRSQILRILVDEEFHSGTDLGLSLGITRAAVNKAVKSLVDMGLEIHRVQGRGYRCIDALPLLDAKQILGLLGAASPVSSLHVLDEVDSTSQYLSALASETDISGHVCLAEVQKQGRGRRGRDWITTPYSNIMLSIAWSYPAGPASLAGLSLAAGVAIVDALKESGISEIGLKWPNDIMWQNKKLGGVLVDIQGEANGPSTVILGVGINVRQGKQAARLVDQQWADLYQVSGAGTDRNQLAASLVDKLMTMLSDFETEGFDFFRQSWQQLHIHKGRPVRLMQAESEFQGTAEGVDSSGALVIRETGGGRRLFHSGEISLRAK